MFTAICFILCVAYRGKVGKGLQMEKPPRTPKRGGGGLMYHQHCYCFAIFFTVSSNKLAQTLYASLLPIE